MQASPLPARATLAAALALHLALLLYFAPPSVMLSDEPVSTIDYALHQYQADRARRAFEGWGRLWAYDPQVLAGQPAGALEDLTSKGLELWVIALSSAGVQPGLAFNLFILVVHLLVPLWAWLAAWLFGLRPMQRAVAVLLWSLVWFFDSFTHWLWYCGMISWAAASCLAVVLVALVYRTVERGPAWLWAAVAPLAALLVTVHPFGAVAAVPACALIYLRRVRRLRWPHHLGLVATLALPVAVSSIWISTALQFWHYVDDLVSFLVPPLSAVLWDYLDVLMNPWDTGLTPVRTLFRVLCLAGAAVAFWRWRKERDPRLLPLGLMVGGLWLLAHAGGLLAATSKIQPYRQIVPATLAAALPAAVLLADLLRRDRLRQLGSTARVLLLLLLLLLAPRVARTVLVNMPDPLPGPHRALPGATVDQPKQENLSGLFALPVAPSSHPPTSPGFRQVRDWLAKNHRGRGRVVVHDWVLGEYLAWSTRVPILGGLEQRALHHGDAHLFRLHPHGELEGQRLRKYFERYAVGFVIVRAPVLAAASLPKLEWRKDLLHFVAQVGGQRIYLTKLRPDLVARGRGKVVSQGLNSIKVEAAGGDAVVLRFHWMEGLRCRPGCRVERQRVPEDRVGFIRVPSPPPRFEIYNSYSR